MEEKTNRVYLRNKTTQQPVPLKGIYVKASIQHSIVEFRMHQFYENCE